MNNAPVFSEVIAFMRHCATAVLSIGFLIQVARGKAKHDMITCVGFTLLMCALLCDAWLWIMNNYL